MTINTNNLNHPIAPMNQEGYVYVMDQLLDDNIKEIFFHCQSNGDWESIGALACVNKYYRECATKYWEQFELKLFCPELRILDAEAQGVTVSDKPQINKLAILKCFHKLAPHVENNEGLTLLTMRKGLTLNQLVAIAAKAGMTVEIFWDKIVQELGDVPVEQTYVILITNSVFKESRNKSYALQKDLVGEHGCEMPTVQEYVALCVFTNIFFQKCLYGQNPWTYGRTSTQFEGFPLIVGGSAPARLSVYNSDFGYEHCGAGGQRKF
jgi:hypothetical protein